ncbi:MAG: DUF58 domain-containing protein [Actinobacteria bacterium]|nr:DUF58 domain-containing protein [Actinomycetota bacterium]
MTRRSSPRLEGYAILAAIGLVAALGLRRPELAIAAAPFALVLAIGLQLAREPRLDLRFTLAGERTVESADVDAEIVVRSEESVDRLELLLELPKGVEIEGNDAMALRLRAGEEQTIPVRLSCSRWGVYEVGTIEARARDPFRLVVWEDRLQRAHELKAYPLSETLTRVLDAAETQAFTGSAVARVKGDGIEYADIRDYVPGDRLRSINWRASARRTGLVVNERHPERNTDVVLFVDSFADLRDRNRSTLDDAVRASAMLATRYLERRDRVGLVSFGGVLRWLPPGMGSSQRFRLIETLLETGVAPTYVWRDVDLIPARILPPKALVIALTPLVDPRFATTLQNLRARGFDLVVVEIDPIGLVQAGRSELERLAYRLWLLDREVLRSRLERLGIGIARWGNGVALESALEEVRTYRRYARVARV